MKQSARRAVDWRRAARISALTLAVAAVLSTAARACDLCAIYTTTEGREEQTGPLAGVAEQYTDFGTEQVNGETVPNPYGEYLHSSVTQILLGYKVLPWLGFQLNLPVIARAYRRVESSGVVSGDVDGFGDMSVIASARPLSWVDTEKVGYLILFGGLKFPTGNPDFLSEEQNPPECIPFPDPTVCGPTSRHAALVPYHNGGPPSGIHGHDLALGSGSYDGLIGAQAYGSWRRLFATAGIQYAIRTVGAFDYQYANDLLFETGPGAYLLLGDDLFGSPYTFGGQVVFSGETKGTDTSDGVKQGDTGITALYLGPSFRFTWSTHLAAEITADLPVLQNNTQLQIVPDYRLRGGVTWRF